MCTDQCGRILKLYAGEKTKLQGDMCCVWILLCLRDRDPQHTDEPGAPDGGQWCPP